MTAPTTVSTLDRSTADLVVDFIALNDASGERHSEERSKQHEEAGGIHDDRIAQRYGYQGALVPGILICSHTMPALVTRWGKEWLARGRIGMKHIRPAFDREELSACFRFTSNAAGEHAEIVVMRGVTPVAVGDASFPPSVPELPSDLPRTPLDVPETLPLAEPDLLRIGQPLFTHSTLIDEAEHNLALSRIGGVSGAWGFGAIHPFVYQHLTSHDAISSFIYSTPGIHVSGDTQMLRWVEPGVTLRSSGHVTNVYERKGHHYFETAQLVQTAEGEPVALCRRSVIYKAREATAE